MKHTLAEPVSVVYSSSFPFVGAVLDEHQAHLTDSLKDYPYLERHSVVAVP